MAGRSQFSRKRTFRNTLGFSDCSKRPPDFPRRHLWCCDANSVMRSADSSLSPHQNYRRQMNINILAIPTIPVWEHRLGPANPWLTFIAKETLGFRRSEFSSDLRLLGPTFSLLGAPAALAGRPSQLPRMLSYHSFCKKQNKFACSVLGLAPLNLQRALP